MSWTTPFPWLKALLPPPRAAAPASAPPPSRLALGLQGGGAFGAYAWGVLDRLLEQPDFAPVAISGASAGAINAAVTAWGLLCGGRDGARAALHQLWTAIGRLSRLSPLGLPSAALQFDLMTRLVSPYQFNPLNLNPLRELLTGMIDFDRLRAAGRLPLLLSATHVDTGRQRIFREHEITVDVLLASACLPQLQQAVTIDGALYWDGGFSANPPVLPLALETPATDLLLVLLTPAAEPGTPRLAPRISGRFKRILFNAALLRELDALSEMQALLRRTPALPADLDRLRDLAVHRIAIDPEFFTAGQSALDPRPALLDRLHAAGRAAAAGLLAGPQAAVFAGPGRLTPVPGL